MEEFKILVVFFLVEICGLGVVVSPGGKAFAVLVVGITGVLVGTTVHLQRATMVSVISNCSGVALAPFSHWYPWHSCRKKFAKKLGVETP